MPTQTLEQTPVLTHYRFSVEDYYRMAELGILDWEARVELLDGLIIEKDRISPRHASIVTKLSQEFLFQLREQAQVRIQQPLRLDPYSEPEPDLALVRYKPNYYSDAHPGPEQVYFLIEVSDASLAKDRKVKLPLYARAGIPEVWIVNLEQEQVEVYSEPGPEGYGKMEAVKKGEEVKGVFNVQFSVFS